jgi:sugar/nucleoside kinase (ribokinase family)
MTLAAAILGAGARALIVTLGARGAVYVTTAGRPDGQTATGFEAVRHLLGSRHPAVLPSVLTSALVPGERVEEPLDPTGCGDVFGGAVFSRLLAGDTLENAVTAGNRAAARNVAYRGASGLAQHLRGELVAP